MYRYYYDRKDFLYYTSNARIKLSYKIINNKSVD